MNELIVKQFESSSVRIIMVENETWWVAKDVCDILDLTNPSESLKPLDSDEKRTLRISEGGPENNIINEAGLYTLIMRSNKPQTKSFRRWVTHDVLPEIRKTGGYSLPKTYTQALEALLVSAKKQEITEIECKRLETENEKLNPLAKLYRDLVETEGLYSWSEASKALHNSFPDIGRTRLTAMLRENGYLMAGKTEPYQRYVEQGLFKVKILTYFQDGEQRSKAVTLCTQKGLDKIAMLLSGQETPAAIPDQTPIPLKLEQINIDSILDGLQEEKNDSTSA